MADEHLFGAFAFGELPDQLDGVADFTVERRVARIDDLTRGVDGFAELCFPIQARVVVHLERQPKRIHLLVTRPALGFPCDPHPLTQCGLWLIRKHRVHGDRHIGNATTQQPFANPTASQDRVIIHGI